ncbi:MAG TPA: A24 family peptidase [Terriglobales bacterium]|jgi:prepilin peptidase CpaA
MISIAPHSLGEWAFSEFACAMNPDVVLFPIAFALAATGAFVDVRERRIPNWLTYTGIVVGFVLRGLLLGWKGMGSALAGCLLAGGIFLLFYVVRAMGAGDVKLVAAIGSLLGPTDALVMLLATAICGGVMAAAYAAYRRQVRSTLINVGGALQFHAQAGLQAHPELNLDNPATLRMPYGLAIAAGTLYVFLAMGWR